MQEIKEIQKSDHSRGGAKRLDVTFTIDKDLPHDRCRVEAHKLLRIYKDDIYCRSDMAKNYFQGEVDAGRRADLKPDVVWLNFAASAEEASCGAFKFHLLWIDRDLPGEERPMGLNGENPARSGVTFKFNY